EFQEDIVTRDMDWTSKSIFNILDDNIYKLMITGSLGNEVLVQIQRGKAIGEIEDFIRQRELDIIVYSGSEKKVIFSSGFSDTYFAQIEKKFIENTSFRTTYGGTEYIGYHIDFDPWQWDIVLLKDKAGYSSLMLQVRNANVATGTILLVSALLLSLYLRSYIKKPVEEIIGPLTEGRTPEYRGIHEFEFISDNIRSMMGSLKESERRYRLLADNVTDVIWTLDMDLNRTYLSLSVMRIRGFSVEELIGMPLSESMTRESYEIVRSTFQQEIDLEGKPGSDPFRSRTLELEFLCKDGSTIWGEVKTSFLRDETGKAIGILGVTRDITERIKARKALRESEERYRQMFERNPLPMMIIEIETLEFLNVNAAAVALYGYSREEFLNMTVKNIRPLEDVEAIVDYISKIEPGIDHQGVWRHKKKDGTIIYVDITSHDMVYGGLRARVGLCNDVTEQLRAQKALSESEERYRTLVEKGMVGVYLIQDRIFVYVNDKLAEIFGYTSDEIVDKKGPEDLVLPEDWPVVRENIRRRINGEIDSVNYDFRGLKKDGTAIQVEVHGSGIEYQGKRAVLGTLLDITERMRAEKALRESEERFRTAFRTSPDAMCINTFESGEFIDINDGFLKLTGYTREEVIGKTIFDHGIWHDDKDRHLLVHGLQTTGQISNMETGFRLKDGSIIPCLYSAKSFFLDDETYILSIASDITELKSAEDKIKASLAEKEILLKEIHHRVKNNLQIISGLLNLQSHYINEEESKEIYRESQNRIITMALIHE
ncbi:MAG: PAS domain S-box protein, partial [bacterium]